MPIPVDFVVSALVTLLVVVGFCIRMRDIDTEAMQWDEVTGYNATMGLRAREVVQERGGASLRTFQVVARVLEGIETATVAASPAVGVPHRA